jgi:hypothetical protein
MDHVRNAKQVQHGADSWRDSFLRAAAKEEKRTESIFL